MENFLVSVGAGALVAVVWELVRGRRQHRGILQALEVIHQAIREGKHVHVEVDVDEETK